LMGDISSSLGGVVLMNVFETRLRLFMLAGRAMEVAALKAIWRVLRL